MTESDLNNLVQTKIKGRTETYYLVTENDLEQIKSNNILGDIAFALFSVTFGLFITSVNYLLLIVSLALLAIAIFFYYFKYSLIHRIKHSGEIEDFKVPKKASEELRITKATYGASSRTVDITEKLTNLIEDNKLSTQATNALVQRDPTPGVVKSLYIEYEHRGLKLSKKFTENDFVDLP